MEEVCKLYGFVPLGTPAVQLAEAIGRFDAQTDDIPDHDAFSLKDIDEQWLALRVELTPCLTRSLAENSNTIRLPLRCYQFGTVWRRRAGKLDRRRALDHFDVDLIGVQSPIGDAELCGLICALLENLGFDRSDYHIRVFNRMVVAALLQLVGEKDPMSCWRTDGSVGSILAAMDAMHSHGLAEVRKMLVGGLPDSWGNSHWSRRLSETEADLVIAFLQTASVDRAEVVKRLRPLLAASTTGEQGIIELDTMDGCLNAFGLESGRVIYDPSFVRGPSFYDGVTLEVVMHHEPATDGAGLMRGKERLRRAVAFGGRYAVQTAQKGNLSAVGMSVDLDRLMLRIKRSLKDLTSPVVVTMLEPSRMDDYIKIVGELRAACVPAELACVSGRFARQIQYADRRGARLAIICGGNEFDAGQVLIRDLWRGREQSRNIPDRKEWLRQSRAAQVSVQRQEIVTSVRGMLHHREGDDDGFARNTPLSPTS
jgi:histidyl-tRNA synthetase